MSNVIDTTTIHADLERLQAELRRMEAQKTQLDTAIVAQRGAISYAELLLGRASENGNGAQGNEGELG